MAELAGRGSSSLHLPPRTRDVQIDYTALSLEAPEKMHFRFKLEGQDKTGGGGQRPPSALHEPASRAITGFA